MTWNSNAAVLSNKPFVNTPVVPCFCFVLCPPITSSITGPSSRPLRNSLATRSGNNTAPPPPIPNRPSRCATAVHPFMNIPCSVSAALPSKPNPNTAFAASSAALARLDAPLIASSSLIGISLTPEDTPTGSTTASGQTLLTTFSTAATFTGLREPTAIFIPPAKTNIHKRTPKIINS